MSGFVMIGGRGLALRLSPGSPSNPKPQDSHEPSSHQSTTFNPKCSAQHGTLTYLFTDPGLRQALGPKPSPPNPCNPGYVFAPVVRMLEKLGYQEGVDLIAAPYDWRFAPSVMEKREGSLASFFRV